MRNIFIVLAIALALVFMSAFANAQTDQTSAGPPLSQPLVREGDFAMKLADSLNLGAAASEAEAESALSAAGIAPRNGWIADYPVTPDIVGELQAAVGEAAESGRLALGKDEALTILQNVVTQYSLNVEMDASGLNAGDTSGTEYADATTLNDYYYNEGPPVVTYYAPPPDYAYLYTWVPYPFWWWNYWFPGFFVLADFHVKGHDHGHYRGHGDHDRGHEKSISNHFRDSRTGRMSRIDPTNRSRGGTLPDRGRTRWSSPAGQSGARSIVNTRRAPSGGVSTGTTTPSGRVSSGTTGRALRGYGSPGSSVGTRSSVFDRSVNRGVERSSSDRGFQSRTNAGQFRGSSPAGGAGRSVAPGGFHGGATGGSRGGASGASGGRGGGGFQGGGRR